MRVQAYLKPTLLFLLIALYGLNARAQPAKDFTLLLNRNVISGGDSVATQIILSSPAAQRTEIKLTVFPASAASVPREVVVAGGESKVEFKIKTAPTTANVEVKVKAEFAGDLAGRGEGSAEAQFKVVPGIIKSMILSKTTLIADGADFVTGTITLESAAPEGGLDVPLSISPDANLEIRNVQRVSAGQSTKSFQIPGKHHHDLPQSGPITIAATLGGTTATVQLTIQSLRIVSCEIAPSSAIGPFQAVATVTLNAPVPLTTSARLISNNVAVVGSAPRSIEAGSDHFSASLSAGAVTSNTTVTFLVRVEVGLYGIHKDHACTVTVLPAR